MKISVTNLGTAISQYIEQELVPMASGLQKVVLYMAMPVIISKLPSMVEQYTTMISLVDGYTEDKMLNIDVLYPKIKEAFHKAGKVPFMGIIFDETDIDKIYARIVPLAQN